jgi:hypothetical protein
MKDIWLDPVILDFDANIVVWTPGDTRSWKRSYSHLFHAEKILNDNSDEFHRIDVITTLKRSLNHRLKLLNAEYKWASIPLQHFPKGELQKLEYIGVAKKRMATKLINIRNRVEHQDKGVPSSDACSEMLEFVWYFLKSTDRLLINVPHEIWFTNEAEQSLVRIRTGPDQKWKVACECSVHDKFKSDHQKDGWIKILSRKIVKKDKLGHKSYLGDVQLSNELFYKLIKIYFYAMG